MKNKNFLIYIVLFSLLSITVLSYSEDFEAYSINDYLNISEWQYLNFSSPNFINISPSGCKIINNGSSNILECKSLHTDTYTNPNEAIFILLRANNTLTNYELSFDQKFIETDNNWQFHHLFYINNNTLEANNPPTYYRCINAQGYEYRCDGIKHAYDVGDPFGTYPLNNTWYHYKYNVLSNSSEHTLLIKKWFFNESEPVTWEINVTDNNVSGSLPHGENGTIAFSSSNATIYLDNIYLNQTLFFEDIEENQSNYTNNAPSIELTSPLNGSFFNTSAVTLSCNASDDLNLIQMVLYSNFSGTWDATDSHSISGTYAKVNFSVNLNNGSYIWNCEVEDNSSQKTFYFENWSFTINNTIIDENVENESNNETNITIVSSEPIAFNYFTLILLWAILLFSSLLVLNAFLVLTTSIYSMYLGFYFINEGIPLAWIFFLIGITLAVLLFKKGKD